MVFQRDIEVLIVSIEVFDTREISSTLYDPLYSICLYYLLNLLNPLQSSGLFNLFSLHAIVPCRRIYFLQPFDSGPWVNRDPN